MPKVSLIWEDVLAAIALLVLMFGTPLLPDVIPQKHPQVASPAAQQQTSHEMAQPVLSFPLGYDAIVIQSGDGIERPVARYYTKKSER